MPRTTASGRVNDGSTGLSGVDHSAERCLLADCSRARTRALDAALCCAAALVGFVVFVAAFGIRILDPTYTKWLLVSDWGQHFLSWDAFRREPWSWPLGRIQNLNWPEGTSLVYTDSLPIVSLPLKLLHDVLPDPFQFQGLWLLACFMLTPAVGYLLFRHVTGSPLVSVLGAAMLPLLPYMLERVGHLSLMAFWLILWAWRLYFTAPRLGTHIWFICLLLVAAAIHPYLLAMIVAIWATWWLHTQAVPLLRPRNFRALGVSAAFMAGQLVLLILIMWAAGYFVIPFSLLYGPGFGYFSLNLNAWFNPAYGLWSQVQAWDSSTLPGGRWSIVLPALPWATDGQYEGFQYPGFGVVLLVLVGLGFLLLKRRSFTHYGATGVPTYVASGWHWLWVPCAFLTLLALSNTITFNQYKLVSFDYPYPLDRLAAVFRSSGRFFWPVNLILMTWALFALTRRLPWRSNAGVVAFCLFIQLIDIHQAFPHRFDFPPPQALASPGWTRIVDRSAYLGFVPVLSYERNDSVLLPLVFMANRKRLRVNTMRVAREDWRYLLQASRALVQQLATDSLPSEASFVIDPTKVCVAPVSLKQRLRVLDGHMVLPATEVGEVGVSAEPLVATLCHQTEGRPQ